MQNIYNIKSIIQFERKNRKFKHIKFILSYIHEKDEPVVSYRCL